MNHSMPSWSRAAAVFIAGAVAALAIALPAPARAQTAAITDRTASDAPVIECTAFRAYPGPPGLRKMFQTLVDAPLTIVAATVVPAHDGLPDYCRIEGYAAASVGFEVRLPLRGWNGRFLHQGCGGMCGSVNLASCEDALARHYAVASTDMGHKSTAGDVKWAMNNWPARIDFGYRATHVATLAAKAVIQAFYGRPPSRSYFRGCSTGGRQGMVEAQRYPEDFDGIVVGAPPLDETGDALLHLIWSSRATFDAGGRQILDSSKLGLVHAAVMKACDGLDGRVDGVLQDPVACRWKPSALRCQAGTDPAACLSDAEIVALERIYGGAHDSKGRKLYAGGLLPGSELQWAPQLVAARGETPIYLYDNGFLGELMRYLAFDNALPADFSLLSFDYDRDPQRLATMEAVYNAQNPDLTRFKARGGKLILWHGWDDIEIPTGVSIEYYRKVEALMGGHAATADFFRLFLVPGVAHCRRGPGADAFDELALIEAWVEQGQAPDVILASHLKKEQTYLGLPRPRFPLDPDLSDWQRPIYPYPDVAIYSGRGNAADPASWSRKRSALP